MRVAFATWWLRPKRERRDHCTMRLAPRHSYSDGVSTRKANSWIKPQAWARASFFLLGIPFIQPRLSSGSLPLDSSSVGFVFGYLSARSHFPHVFVMITNCRDDGCFNSLWGLPLNLYTSPQGHIMSNWRSFLAF